MSVDMTAGTIMHLCIWST